MFKEQIKSGLLECIFFILTVTDAYSMQTFLYSFHTQLIL